MEVRIEGLIWTPLVILSLTFLHLLFFYINIYMETRKKLDPEHHKTNFIFHLDFSNRER